LRWLYTAAAALAILGLFTEGIIASMLKTEWGWSPVTGPLLPLHYGLASGCVACGLALFRGRVQLQDAHFWSLLTLSTAIPLLLVSLTDVVLPALGIHSVPRLGVASLALVAGMQSVVVYRRGEQSVLPEGVTSAVLRALPDGVASVTHDGFLRSANDRFAALVGLPAGGLVGRRACDYLPAQIVAEPRDFRDFECDMTTAEGERFPVSVSGSLRQAGSSTPGLVLIVRDLREVSALRKRLMLSGRMAAVGALGGGIAHELNNPLAYIGTNLAALREHAGQIEKELRQLPHWEQLKDLVADCESIIDESLEGIDRATAIVRDVREFSHAGDPGLDPTDLSALIEQSVRVARLQIPAAIEVSVELPELPTIAANGQRLMQVLVNLLVNAGHSIEHAGRICVTAETQGQEISLLIRDDGCGIAAGDLERIFDPFFTTKPVGIGTGLGLAIAFGIVREHGGAIEVNSVEGEGSEFRVRLPTTPCSPEPSDTRS
jgi:signal transduction histidine kinase